MKTYKMYESSLNSGYLDRIVEELRGGGVILYPTDSFYALGCSALSNKAVERVCAIKGINPERQRLSMVCADISQAAEYSRIDNRAFRLLKDSTPGAVTFILPGSNRLARAFKGRKEVGVRIPDNAIARELAQELGAPLLSASAVWEGADEEDLRHPESVALHYENEVDLIVDGGEVAGIPTAVVSLMDSAEPEVVRGEFPL